MGYCAKMIILSEEEKKKHAWQYTTIVSGYDPNMYRKDACGAWIRWDMYGQQDSLYGWQVDHIYPRSRGGDDNPLNLRALQHQNNASKGDDYPSYEAVITSKDNTNIEQRRSLTVNDEKRQQLAKLYHINA